MLIEILNKCLMIEILSGAMIPTTKVMGRACPVNPPAGSPKAAANKSGVESDMNLYEVTISGTQQLIQASKPEVALNEAIRRIKYGEGMRLGSVLKENHSIYLEINIKNLGKMVRIQKIDDQYTRQYVLKTMWEQRQNENCLMNWEVCPDARTTSRRNTPVYSL